MVRWHRSPSLAPIVLKPLLPKVRTTLLPSAIVLSLAGCTTGSDDATPSPSPQVSCVADGLEQQPRLRFPAGSTFYLPTTDPSCATATWTLSSAPSSNQNAIVVGTDGYSRFTPVVAGTYEFSLTGTDETETLTVIPASDVPFHNYNYYASASIAPVGGELWTANVFAASITRINPATLAVIDTLDVGPWPVALAEVPGQNLAIVAQRGNDTLGLIDVSAGRLVDALWVGDEPSNLLVSADGKTAYVTLATEAAVAVVDLNARAVTGRFAVGPDPLAMALAPDGKTLYVATHRSGHPNRYPFEDDPLADEKDLYKIDVATGASTAFLDIGTTINALLMSADGAHLYVANTLNDTEANLADPEELSFVHEVVALDAETGERAFSADLARQESSGGFAVSLHGMTLAQGLLWVTAEGSDITIGLDPTTLEERQRVATPGRPRSVAAIENALFTHGAQGFTVTGFSAEGNVEGSVTTTSDPRPAAISGGQRYFTGAGREYGQNWSCNSCHLDALTDTIVWNAGPLEDRAVPRPMFWLEGAYPLGWAGYLSNVRNYAFTVNTNVGIRPNTAEAENLWAYLASIMPPPAANGLTERDGSLSEAGLRGKALYEGKAACSSCHATPLTTNHAVLPEGITGGPTDIPALVGIYRHNVWMKHGESRTLLDAVTLASDWLGVSLSPDELSDLTHYIGELTGRDFFLLVSEPLKYAAAAPVNVPITLTFSLPVYDQADNLAHILLKDAAGAAVPAKVDATGRTVTLTPNAALKPGAQYQIVLERGLESFDQKPLFLADGVTSESISFTTAPAPALTLDGEYLWTVQVPGLDFENGEWDTENTSPASVLVSADKSASGAEVVLDYLDNLLYPTQFVVSDSTLISPPIPIPVGPSFADSTGIRGTLVDEDGDGVGDSASGTLTMSGPGFVVPDVAWTFTRPISNEACEEGSSGSPAIVVTRDENGQAVVSWEGAAAISFYVTDPSAILPTGPNATVRNGETYWALEVIDFDLGFVGPVTYGTVPENAADATERHAGHPGATPLEPGRCYKFSVINKSFSTGTLVMKWE